jgi:GntR family transcriptional repressor for pyruvate dehydrogenase complex
MEGPKGISKILCVLLICGIVGSMPRASAKRTERATPAGAGVTASVVARLERLVLNELDPGAELPSETDIARQLGVSRLTVREATRSLQARGLVEISQGRRPTVAHPNAGPIGDFFSTAVRRDPRRLMDLLEVRRAIEVQVASLAATRASRAAVSAMETSLHAMKEAPDDPVGFHDADIHFHESVAEGAGNQMLSFLIEALAEPLRSSRMRSMQGHLARGGTVGDVIDQHARILERIKARDSEGAAAAMREHLSQTARDLRTALALTERSTAETLDAPAADADTRRGIRLGGPSSGDVAS